MSVWWLSYVSEHGEARGVVIVEAQDFLTACAVSRQLELSPGGEVRGFEVPDDVTMHAEGYRNRFYPPEDARAIAELD